jgi:hypothetical protein
VFLGKGDDRRLLMLTPRDPHSCVLQSFNQPRHTCSISSEPVYAAV